MTPVKPLVPEHLNSIRQNGKGVLNMQEAWPLEVTMVFWEAGIFTAVKKQNILRALMIISRYRQMMETNSIIILQHVLGDKRENSDNIIGCCMLDGVLKKRKQKYVP